LGKQRERDSTRVRRVALEKKSKSNILDLSLLFQTVAVTVLLFSFVLFFFRPDYRMASQPTKEPQSIYDFTVKVSLLVQHVGF